MESDDEYDDLPQGGQAASTLPERRRAQKAKFEAWLTSDAVQEALKPKTKESKAADAADEELSIHSLMAKEGTEIIKSPRDYQLELFERAKTENTIAVLDTGSGKTLIAVLLLRWVIDNELERRAAGEPPKISCFLVQSVTLVYQQFSVLETNLDHAVTRVCGADNADNWQKSKWAKLFSENKVIVCTADILHKCLGHSYITMKQINLLIFDEAHHTKKNHVYARLIKDFYLEEPDETTRPRIFGMTASPIDAKSDVVQAANELETLLHSRIATTEDMSFTEAVKKPAEHILWYSALPQPFETQFLRSLKATFGHIQSFRSIFATSLIVAKELGSWCGDQYLASALSENRLRRYEMKAERKFYARSSDGDVKELDQAQAELRSCIELAEKERRKLDIANINDADFSLKTIGLRKYLSYQFERPTSQRCIVFVERRHTARLLDALFRRIGTPHMRSAFLVGGNHNDSEDTVSFRQQVMTLIKFRKGEFNCLFATSVAEEGLDVPDCNLVIRFDIYRTMIQFVQSRGRARQANSKFIHMLEYGNSIHQQLASEVRHQEAVMRRFCQALPADRRLVGQEDNLDTLLSKEKGLRVYTEPSTGAKLTYGNALAVLANFVSAIPTQSDETLHPSYSVQSKGSKFVGEVLLPPAAQLRSAIGRVCTKKSLAKRSAAFQACLELRKTNLLDVHFMPTFEKRVNAMRNALLAVDMKKTNQYLMRKKPSVWEQGRGTLPQELWMTVIDFPNGLERQHQRLALLTRTRMPDFPAFSVYLNNGRESTVTSRQLAIPLRIENGRLDKLSKLTFRVLLDVFSKKFEPDGAALSYWLGPVRLCTHQNIDNPNDLLDWTLLDEVSEVDEYQWDSAMPHQALIDKFLVDRWHGGRKYFSTAIDPSLRPLDPVPENIAKGKGVENILGNTVSLWKNSREKAIWSPEQPVMRAEKLLLRLNMLATPTPKESTLVANQTYLCPEPLRISVLPPALVTSCFVFPAIIHRFESYLIALEACNMVGVVCNPDIALAAVTKDSDNSSEHESQERINFRRGMGENYERLEFIGDTFLKTSTTISTFIQNPNDNESEFHIKRMLLLCNKNLFEVAKELHLHEYIRSIAFSRRLWYPEGLKLLEGKGVNKQEETAVIKHGLGDKSIADVCEALIGAAFVSHDKPGEEWHEQYWENAVRAVTKLVGSADHAMNNWNGYRLAYDKPEYQTADSTASQRDLAEKVELEHAYHFKYPRLLRSAFIHPSQPLLSEKVPNYQRLEFLGDALLDMASITYLFYRFPDKDPQWLTEHKMAMVSNRFLGAVSVNTGFHKHLRHSSAILEHQIREYATELQEAKRTAGDHRDYWTTVSDPPKCLPDIVESYVGAMFIDSNFDYNVVQTFFDRHIKWYFEDMSIYDTFANNHPCTHLHNLLQTTYGCQDYRLMAKELPPIDGMDLDRKDVVAAVMIHDEIVAYSKGKSGRYARYRAANDAVEIIEGLAPFEFRSKFLCDCSVKSDTSEPLSTVGPVTDCGI